MTRYNSNILASLSASNSSGGFSTSHTTERESNSSRLSTLQQQLSNLSSLPPSASSSERNSPSTLSHRHHTKQNHHLHHHHNHSVVYSTGSNIDQMLGVKVNTYLLKKSEGDTVSKASLERKKNLIQETSDSSSDDDDDSDDPYSEDEIDMDSDNETEQTEVEKSYGVAGKTIYEFRECDAAEYISSRLIDHNDYIDDIKLCYASTFFITKKKRVFMIGNNFLEIGYEKILIIPKEVTWDSCQTTNKLKEIACGHFHIVLLTEQREILVGGSNNYGQLGHPAEKDEEKPTEQEDDDFDSSSDENEDNQFKANTFEIKEIEDKRPVNNLHTLNYFFLELKGDIIDSVYCGAFFTIYVTKLKKIYICGQIGFDDSNILKEPTRIRFFDSSISVSKVFCGSDDIYFLTSDKKVYGFSLLEPETITQKPTHFSQMEYFLDEHPNSIIEFGLGHTVFVTNNHQVYCFGSNGSGECGMGEKEYINKITLNSNFNDILGQNEYIANVTCGANTSVFTTNQGSIIICGENVEGQLGCMGRQSCTMIPVKIESFLKNPHPSRLKVYSGYHNTFVLYLPESILQV